MNPIDTQESQAKSALKLHLALAGTAVIGAIVLLFTLLRYNGFWVDEVYTLHAVRLGWGEMVMERLRRGHFPGYFTLVRLWFDLWPERFFETALRSLSVIFYLAAVASFWPLARRVLSSPASLVALTLFALNGVALRQASEARMYTLVLLIAVWMVRAWAELQRPDTSRLWALAMILLTMAGFAVSATVTVLVGSMLLISFYRGDRRLRWVLVLALVLGMSVFIPGAIMHVKTAVRLGISASKPLIFVAHPVALMPGIQLWDDYFKTDWRLATLLILGIPVTLTSIFILIRNRSVLPKPLGTMGLIVALPLAGITLCYPLVEWFSLSIMGPPRYFITLLPMASLLGGWALARLPRPALMHALLTFALLFNAWSILTVRVEKFRPVLQENLEPLYKPGDGLVVTVEEGSDAVELYVPGSKVDIAIDRWERDERKLGQQLAALNDRQTVWIVWFRGGESPLIKVATDLWGPGVSNRPEKTKGNLFIYKFSPLKSRQEQ